MKKKTASRIEWDRRMAVARKYQKEEYERYTIGIDPSMQSTGICIYDKKYDEYTFFGLGSKRLSEKCHPPLNIHPHPEKDLGSRIDKITTILSYIPRGKFFMEGYSYGSKGKIFEIGEFVGGIKYHLYKSKIDINIISPKSIKKFATGSGNSGKEIMELAMKKKFPEVYKLVSELPSHPKEDIIDAFWICRYGIEEKEKKEKGGSNGMDKN